MDIALVTAAHAWETDDDAPLLIAALEVLGITAGPVRWDDNAVDWTSFDMVVLKSPWDYTDRHGEFAAWTESTAAVAPLFNSIGIIRWNSDKRYLADLAELGIPVVSTHYVSPGDLPADASGQRVLQYLHDALATQFADNAHAGDGTGPAPDGADKPSIVVKPTVSAGSKNTARYGRDQLESATHHALELLRAGRTVMVQPYLDSVEQSGETGLVYLGGEFSHAFRKGPLLSQGKSDVDGLFAVEHITPRRPSAAELRLGERTVAAVAGRFPAADILYTRVDLLRSDDDQPVLLELEMVEPSYFLTTDPASPARAALAYRSALERVRGG